MRGEDRDEALVLLMGFAEVGTESALSIMNCWHIDLLGRLLSLVMMHVTAPARKEKCAGNLLKEDVFSRIFAGLVES
jgi:hypothetical protein